MSGAHAAAPILAAEGLVRLFAENRGAGLLRPRRYLRAVDDVSFALMPAETLALVGESGSGKSTLGRLLLRLLEPSAGRVLYAGRDYSALSGEALRDIRRRVQMVFQDP